MTLSAAKDIQPARFPGLSVVRVSDILVFILLIGFSLQGIVAQTHIHGAAVHGVPAIESLSIPVPETRHDSDSPRDDEAHCLLCQIATLATGLSLPTTAGMPVAVQILLGVMAILSSQMFIVRAVGHEGRQRAPPHR